MLARHRLDDAIGDGPQVFGGHDQPSLRTRPRSSVTRPQRSGRPARRCVFENSDPAHAKFSRSTSRPRRPCYGKTVGREPQPPVRRRVNAHYQYQLTEFALRDPKQFTAQRPHRRSCL
jgi:hypothetical protein